MSIFSGKKFKRTNSGDFHKNPFLLFGSMSLILFGMLFFGSGTLAQLDGNKLIAPTTLSANDLAGNADPYFNQHSATALEAPDFKTSQESFVYGVATPSVVTTQTLSSIMGTSVAIQDQGRKDIIDYEVQPGDTPSGIAASFNISVNTLLWANDITKNTVLKTGQSLIILPQDGLLHIVKSGDTLEGLIKNYKGNMDETTAFNGIAEGIIYTGDTIFVAGGLMPAKKAPVSIAASIGSQNILPDSFFIPPLLKFRITQGLHYLNGVDFSSPEGCGAAVYASASGTVQRAVGNGAWNGGKGNHVTILHANGVSTYYGHLMSLFVKPGDVVNTGDRIGLEGKTGKATGCHVHWQVMGAKNPYGKLPVGYAQ